MSHTLQCPCCHGRKLLSVYGTNGRLLLRTTCTHCMGMGVIDTRSIPHSLIGTEDGSVDADDVDRYRGTFRGGTVLNRNTVQEGSATPDQGVLPVSPKGTDPVELQVDVTTNKGEDK